MFLTTPSSASRTLQSRFSNLEFSLLQTCGKDYNFPPGFILLTVWKITTLDESNEFPLTLHHLVGIGNSQPASFVFLSMVIAGFRTIPAMNFLISLFRRYLNTVKPFVQSPLCLVPPSWNWKNLDSRQNSM